VVSSHVGTVEGAVSNAQLSATVACTTVLVTASLDHYVPIPYPPGTDAPEAVLA